MNASVFFMGNLIAPSIRVPPCYFIPQSLLFSSLGPCQANHNLRKKRTKNVSLAFFLPGFEIFIWLINWQIGRCCPSQIRRFSEKLSQGIGKLISVSVCSLISDRTNISKDECSLGPQGLGSFYLLKVSGLLKLLNVGQQLIAENR